MTFAMLTWRYTASFQTLLAFVVGFVRAVLFMSRVMFANTEPLFGFITWMTYIVEITHSVAFKENILKWVKKGVILECKQ